MDVLTDLAGQSTVDTNAGLTGMLAGTQVCTLDGVLPVEFLEPGDRIVTRAGARTLMAVSVRLERAAALVRIRASSIGHGRPEEDLMLAPGQSVVIRDWRARALYDSEVAAIPAARLADGEFVVSEMQANARFYTLRFAEDEVVYAEGVEVACTAVAAARSIASLTPAN